jgi:hypothetical protein
MPIDAAVLDQYITEVAGDDAELKTLLSERFGKNQNAAAKFTNGFLGRADVTRRQQEIADQRKQFDSQKSEYETRLLEAENEKDKIMKDLAEERISASRAKALLKTVKQAYSLTDADLPGIDDIKETVRTGTVVDSTPDIDKRLDKFKKDLFKELNDQLIPEISGMAILGPVWNDMAYEHERLFGKRLTKKEQQDILAEARTANNGRGRSIESVWAEKYNVDDRRLTVRDEENKKKYRLEWEDEQAKKNQDLALSGVRPESNEFALEDRQSPIFKRNFAPPEEGHSADKPADRNAAPIVNDAARERMGGAERAAAKFMERARNGQLGKPLEPARKTA